MGTLFHQEYSFHNSEKKLMAINPSCLTGDQKHRAFKCKDQDEKGVKTAKILKLNSLIEFTPEIRYSHHYVVIKKNL